MQNGKVRKIVAALSAVGPGLFLIGYNIGTGSVTTMAKAGAEHGMTLFWVLVLACIFAYVLMVAYGRLTIVTGHTALFNIKNGFKFGKLLAVYILIALIIGELLAIMGIMGIVADLLREASRLIFGGEGFSTFWIIFWLAVVMCLLLWYGKYPSFEKVLIFFVIQMSVCFFIVFFMLKPNMSEIVGGLIPHIPDRPGAMGLIAATAGTACSAAVFIMRSPDYRGIIGVAEKGWKVEHLKDKNRDAFVSAFVMLILSGVVMAVSAGTLHVMGLKLDNTVEMIKLFEPIGGKLAAFILILGVVGAGLSTVFPIILIAPWLVCDYMGRPRDVRSPTFRVFGLLGILFCFGSQFIRYSPPIIMIFSQAFQACILPAVVLPVYVLINRKEVMNDNVADTKMNFGLAAVFVFAVLVTFFAIGELIY